MLPLSKLMTHGRAANHPVALSADTLITFGTFSQDVRANAQQLSDHHVDNVTLYAENSYSFAVVLMAALANECKISLPPNGQPGTLAKATGTLLSDLPHADGLSILHEVEGEFTFKELNPSDLKLDFFTSGSTGEPQVVRKHLFQLENEIAVLENTWGAELQDSLVLATVSHQHIYGMLFKVLWSLSSGRPFQCDMFEYWENLFPCITNNCFIVSSPAHLTRYPNLDVTIKPKKIFSSGGPLSFDAAQETNIRFSQTPTEVFGSTETGGIAYRSQTKNAVPWVPFKEVKTKVNNDGLLSIRSPYLETDDWYEMNDRVEFDLNNHFQLKGRADRIVKVEGKRVSLVEVETVLSVLPFTKEAAVLITDDQRQSLSAIVVLSDEGIEKRHEMGDFRLGRFFRNEMRDTLEQAALPRRWRFVEQIPVNAQGKRLRKSLLALFVEKWLDSKKDPEILGERVNGSIIELDLIAPSDLFQFQGHFSEQPILPGIAQVDWAVRFAKDRFALSADIQEISQLKFRQLILPDRPLTLKLDHQSEKKRIAFSFSHKGDVFSSGFLKLGTS